MIYNAKSISLVWIDWATIGLLLLHRQSLAAPADKLLSAVAEMNFRANPVLKDDVEQLRRHLDGVWGVRDEEVGQGAVHGLADGVDTAGGEGEGHAGDGEVG
ncbi:hypothetical protein BJ878DRAFT_505130 [Calycina marina]|uniref:Uncharacterized protein n=1 Tax=Calycina marina TaxID=1763456 RepID=A0A9P7Z3K5_9HELO|nr:hypothetical protein BJ878DRAFT_505130 [Calycina marina]